MKHSNDSDFSHRDDPHQQGHATTSRVAIYGAVIAIVFGAVFYGLNDPTAGPTGAQSRPPATIADNGGASLPNIRDVTPGRQSGMTTGSAPSGQQGMPQSEPVGTDIDPSKGSATR